MTGLGFNVIELLHKHFDGAADLMAELIIQRGERFRLGQENGADDSGCGRSGA
jgi:hypothetical protein